MHKLFVYGTLRPGTGPLVEVSGSMYDLGSYPGVKLGGNSHFMCEVLEVDDNELAALDRYEGYYENEPESSLYLRVQHDGGWIYEFNGPMMDYPFVEGGDWLVYRNQERGRAARYLESV